MDGWMDGKVRGGNTTWGDTYSLILKCDEIREKAAKVAHHQRWIGRDAYGREQNSRPEVYGQVNREG